MTLNTADRTVDTGVAKPTQRRWIALAILAIAEFLVMLDASIVNIALPSIGANLHLDTAQLSWVITAYVLPLGGLLLLGGRLADRFGHRRVFFVGVVGFIAASALAGFSLNGGMLLGARAIQGASAALLMPASLALVTRLFPIASDRAKALGVWGAVAGIGSAAGVLLGGVLTAAFGWEAIFFVNVPAGLVVLIALPFLIGRDRESARVRLDLAGALTVTGGLVSLVGALSLSEQLGFDDPLIIGLFVAAALLLTAFAIIEHRSAQPLIDLRIFRLPTVAGGNAAMLFAGAATTATFFALSVFMQQVLGFSALESGLTQLPLAGTLVIIAGVVPSVLARFGARRVLVVALLVLAAGLVWLSFAPADATFVGSLLVPTIVIGAGLGASFIATTQLAVDSTSGSDAGLASGLVNTSQQVGGALGLAVLSTIAANRTTELMASGTAKADALTSGFGLVFLGAAAAAVLGAIAVTVITRGRANSTTAQ